MLWGKNKARLGEAGRVGKWFAFLKRVLPSDQYVYMCVCVCVHISVRLLFIWQNIQRLGFSLGWRNHNTGISLSWWECEVCGEEFTKGQSSLFKHRVVTKILHPGP